jgi:hypothetical protein
MVLDCAGSEARVNKIGTPLINKRGTRVMVGLHGATHFQMPILDFGFKGNKNIRIVLGKL